MSATDPLRACAPDLSWVDEGRLHLTLKFFGEQPPERLADIQDATAAVAAAHRQTAMALGGVGAFPNFRRARVVWMGVAPDPRLELLHHDIEVAFHRIGFEIEGRPFRPHITLARVRRAIAEDQKRALARRARATTYETEFTITSIDLMQSEMSANGFVYTTLASAPLRSM